MKKKSIRVWHYAPRKKVKLKELNGNIRAFYDKNISMCIFLNVMSMYQNSKKYIKIT